MEKQNIIISTMPVTIKIMEVGGKKMTMSVFRQIPEKDFYQEGSDKQKRASWFLGWIKTEVRGYNNVKYFLFSIDGTLYKWLVKKYHDFEYEIKELEARANDLQKSMDNYIRIRTLGYEREIGYLKDNSDADKYVLIIKEQYLMDISNFENTKHEKIEKIESLKKEADAFRYQREVNLLINEETRIYATDDKNQIYISI